VRDPKDPPLEIVGVARNVKYMRRQDEDRDAMFVPLIQEQEKPAQHLDKEAAATLIIRTVGDPASMAPAVRAAVRSVDPNLPILDMTTMEAQVSTSLVQQRLLAILSSFFGALALGLAAIGLYGVLSYGVSQRSSEIGIRMALGAQRGGIVRMILGETARMVLMGIVAGLGIALAAGRMIRSMLYGVTPADPLSLAAVIAILAGVALVAGFLPARRAAMVEPMTALREE
jgi:putative ABC transport system permease protein